MKRLLGAALIAGTALIGLAPTAGADLPPDCVGGASGLAALSCLARATPAPPPPPGCERVPVLGIAPYVREICDLPIQPDGSWTRWRWASYPGYFQDSCGGNSYFVDGALYCPLWARQKHEVPWRDGPVEKYVLTADTIPAGEPGYIGG